MITHAQTSNFGEIASLREVFLEAKKLRRARCPAYVLLVEDDPLTRHVVVGTLGESNALITEENAQNAVTSYLLHAPDVVFLDIGLPDSDGFTVLDQIMAIDPDAFVVMFSGHKDLCTIDKALKNGAKGFVSKPFKREALHNYIKGSSVHHHKYCI